MALSGPTKVHRQMLPLSPPLLYITDSVYKLCPWLAVRRQSQAPQQFRLSETQASGDCFVFATSLSARGLSFTEHAQHKQTHRSGHRTFPDASLDFLFHVTPFVLQGLNSPNLWEYMSISILYTIHRRARATRSFIPTASWMFRGRRPGGWWPNSRICFCCKDSRSTRMQMETLRQWGDLLDLPLL